MDSSLMRVVDRSLKRKIGQCTVIKVAKASYGPQRQREDPFDPNHSTRAMTRHRRPHRGGARGLGRL